MAVHIVRDVPATGGMRRLARAVAVVLGLILVLAGLIAAVLPLLYLIVSLTALVDRSDPPAIEGDDVVPMAIATAIAVIAPWVGLRLIRGRRRLGLYLRKFGFQDSTRTVTYALASAAGRSLRLVTLDDTQVAPVGTSRTRRWTALWVTVLATAAVAAGVYWLIGGGFDAAASSITDDAFEEVGGGSLADVLGGIIGAAIAAAIGIAVLLILVLVPVAFAVGVSLFGGGSYLAARRAQRSATRSITNERAIEPTARSVAARSRGILGARLVVVGVVAAYWQRAVQALAAVSDLVVIDVSQPTDNLLWEVSAMRPAFAGRWVLVGADEQVAALAAPHTLEPGSVRERLARLLDGEQIISYGTSRADLRRFARALRHRVHATRPRS